MPPYLRLIQFHRQPLSAGTGTRPLAGNKDPADPRVAPVPVPGNVPPSPKKDKQFRIGQQVWHSEYGRGLVLSVDGVGPDARLTISFDRGKLTKIIGTFVSTEPL